MNVKLIINADDFGQTQNCTKAIAQAFEEGLISSTTACANGEYIETAYEIAKEKGFVDCVGIHINFTEGKPLTQEIADDPFFCENGEFHGKINRFAKLTAVQKQSVQAETEAQIDKLRAVGFSLSHADSHHHIHTAPCMFEAVYAAIICKGIDKIRLHRNVGKIPFYKRVGKAILNKKLYKKGLKTTRYFGGLDDYQLCSAPLKKGVCEVMVHPDYDENGALIDRRKRESGVAVGVKLKEILPLVKESALGSYKEL